MIETNIFEKWLDAEAERVGNKLAANQNLYQNSNKMTILAVNKAVFKEQGGINAKIRLRISNRRR